MLASLWKNLTRHPLAIFGMAIWVPVLAAALVGPALVSIPPNQQDLLLQFQQPLAVQDGVRFWLGTDQFGRDVLSRLLTGSMISISVAFAAVSLGGIMGTVLGLVSGFYRGPIDGLVMRTADVQLSLPPFLLAIALAAVTGPGVANVIGIIGVTSWVSYARVVRGNVLSTRRLEFVEAARALGARDRRILVRHVLPAVLPVAVVMATLQIARAVVLEATLSFLGVGVPITIPTWGGMLSEGKGYMHVAWWMMAFPGLALTLIVLATDLIGDALTEILDPRVHHARTGRAG